MIDASTIKETIQQELDQTRTAYHHLLSEIPDNAWELPTAYASWNVRQVLFHITTAYKFLPQDLKMLRRNHMNEIVARTSLFGHRTGMFDLQRRQHGRLPTSKSMKICCPNILVRTSNRDVRFTQE